MIEPDLTLAQLARSGGSLMSVGLVLARAALGPGTLGVAWKDDIMAGSARVAVLPCVVVVAALWYFSRPAWFPYVLAAAVVLAVASVLLWMRFRTLDDRYTTTVKARRPWYRPWGDLHVDRKVVSGDEFTTQARDLRDSGVSEERVFLMLGAKPERVWTPDSITSAKDRLRLTYVLLLNCSTVALAAASLAVAAKLS